MKPNDAEGWVKTSVSLRASTRRRLKTFAAEHDMRIQEVVDAALETYLGLEGNDERVMAPRTAGLHLSRGIVRSDGRDGRTVARRAGSSSFAACAACASSPTLSSSWSPSLRWTRPRPSSIGPSRCFSSSRIFSFGSRCGPPARPCAARAGGTMQTAPPIR
mgnify:CR=1 FL=1